jgi:uncharacterized cupin superfamily protein
VDVRISHAKALKARRVNGHHLINETQEEVLYLKMGDRTSSDEGSYPDV